MANKDHGDCDCLFCNSRCPECGSTDVEVKFKLGFTYSNRFEDNIHLDRVDDEIELQCGCGEWIDGNEDGRLDELLDALVRAINPPDGLSAKIKEGGKITFEPYHMVAE